MNARPLAALLVLAPLVAVFACGGGGSRPADTTIPSASAPLESREAVDASSPSSDAAPVVERETSRLPSGDYEITTEVQKDTCSKGDAGPASLEAVTMFVQMKVWRDKSGHERITGNFPLPLPRARSFGSARSDVVLSPRAAAEPTIVKGMGSQCPSYETKTLYEVLSLTSDQVKVRYTRDYGDASTCPARTQPPSKCSLDYVYTFKLAKKICDPYCEVTFAKGAGLDGGPGPKCNCDAGAP